VNPARKGVAAIGNGHCEGSAHGEGSGGPSPSPEGSIMCTNIVLSTSQCVGSRLSARSMDYSGTAKLTWSVRYVPTGQSFPSSQPQNPFTWTNTLAFVGIIAVTDGAYPVAIPYFYDGLNTAGLSAASLDLPESIYASSSETTPNLYVGDLVGWALGTCSTV